jgi:hypothetical protein
MSRVLPAAIVIDAIGNDNYPRIPDEHVGPAALNNRGACPPLRSEDLVVRELETF